MGKKDVVFLFVFALVAISLCSGQNTTTATVTGAGGQNGGQATIIEKTALQKGMDQIFKLYHNFLNTVMKKDFYADNTAFNVHVLIRVVNESDYGRLQQEWRDLVSTFGGYAACVIIGLMFVLFMPIAGCIFCCCHCCCHKCGGTKETKDPNRASCKRWTYTIILLICTTFMLAGGVITFLGSDLLRSSLKNDNNQGFAGHLNSSLGLVQKFADDTIKEVVDKGKSELTGGADKIIPKIRSAVENTVTRIKDTINATQLLNQADKLGNASKSALTEIRTVTELLSTLKVLQNNVSTTLTKVRTDVNNSCGSPCASYISGLSFKPNYSKLGELTDQAASLEKAANITDLVSQAKGRFDQVSSNISTTVQHDITEAVNLVNETKNSVTNKIDDLKNSTKGLNDGVQKGQTFTSDSQKTINEIANYTWYTCIGLGCAILLVVFFYYLGVLFGLCGERPGHRANCCNRGTGANLLCAGICFSFLFAWILMLVTLLMFALGGLSYSMACKYVTAPSGIEGVATFEKVVSDGFKLNISSALGVQDLTLGGMFQACKDNKGVYSAFHLKDIFNIDEQFNLSDVIKKVKEFTNNNNFHIDDIKLLDDDLKHQLDQFKNASLNNINFTEYTEELNKKLIDADLRSVISSLRNASTTYPTLNSSANDLQHLQDHEIKDIETATKNLTDTLTRLQRIANESVVKEIDNLKADIQSSQDKFNSQKDNITKQELEKVSNEVVDDIGKMVNSTLNYIKEDAGRCRSLYDAAQGVVDSVCVYTLDPLNAIWFGIGWSLFFYIPCIIFAALLASLYKRSEKYDGKSATTGFDDPFNSQYSGAHSNGYHGGRNDDSVPLTSIGKEQPYSSNGAYNQGYQGYEGRDKSPEARYHRDQYPGYPPNQYPHDRAAPRGSSYHYEQPRMDPYDQPPLYDDAMSPHHYRGSHGGYPSSRHY